MSDTQFRWIIRILSVCIIVAAALLLGWAITADARTIKQRANHSWNVCWKTKLCDPGRNIARWGVKSKSGLRDASRRELRKTYRQLRENISYARSPKRPARFAIATNSNGSTNPMVNPACESGGNPQAVDPTGTYWGKYQFDYQTWVAHGGAPSAYGSASEAVQDQIASSVHYDAWPNC